MIADHTPEVAAMSDTDLRANLCTIDWRGRAFKEAALDELIDRAISATLSEVRGQL